MENEYLNWIKLAAPFLSLTSLEQHIGIPFQTLHRYLKTGDFPEKHLPLLQEKLEPIVRLRPGWITEFARQLLEERQRYIGAVKIGNPQQAVHACNNARQEQILDDLARCYLILRTEHPDLAREVYAMLSEASPLMCHLAEYLDRTGNTMSLDDIRNLPVGADKAV